jgi:hypothetical protein
MNLILKVLPALQIARSECMYTPRMRADENPNHFKISVQTFDASRQNGSCVLILHSRTHNQLGPYRELFFGEDCPLSATCFAIASKPRQKFSKESKTTQNYMDKFLFLTRDILCVTTRNQIYNYMFKTSNYMTVLGAFVSRFQTWEKLTCIHRAVSE